jgi:diguanylate cyclase (GGDEF)-like protein
MLSSREVDPIALLLDLTARLSTGLPLEAALTAVTDTALVLLGADHASVRLVDPTHATLLASARSGQGRDSPQVSLRSGEGIAGWVLQHGQSARADDVVRDGRFKPAGTQGFAIRSMVAAPLCASGTVVGVLSASSASAAAFTEHHERLAQLLANCSVPLLERARLERLATTDHLTLAFCARQLHPLLERAMATGPGGPSLLLFDLDDFKRVNDAHGHAAGDAILRLVADRVRDLTRDLDLLVRRGGDEFVVVMPSTTLAQARLVADRVREGIAAAPFVVGGSAIVQTVSIGMAAWEPGESPEAFERRADQALYDAKRDGRNRVAVADAPRGKGIGLGIGPILPRASAAKAPRRQDF